MEKHSKKSKTKLLIFVLILLILSGGAFLGYKIMNDKQEVANTEVPENNVLVGEAAEVKQVQIFNGNDRPIAVMLDNNSSSWPHSGIQDAYLVYEIIVEGGETRLMALFKGEDVEKIGSVRSARHYFLDYAMENDAIFAHFGQSPQAESDISRFNINNISGILEDGTTFWRVTNKYAPHNAVTSTKNLLESAKSKGYRTTSTDDSVLNYVTDEVLLDDGVGAISVTIPHSDLQTVKYVYNEETKLYERYARGKVQNDELTSDIITTKNIIISFADNYTLPNESVSGRQGLENIGTSEGYYITNGKAIKITVEKSSRSSKTIYKDLNGNEIDVNDGNTFINICPEGTDIILEKPVEVNPDSYPNNEV